MKKRVVITGLGVVSALGIGVDNFWNSIKEGKNGISTVSKFDVSNMNCKVAAEIKEFDVSAATLQFIFETSNFEL
ncbi:MAG: 3-oxoacyl-(acyl-carrier-protein) synthase 2 [Firmicutes bacterium ADurb.Bin419]|nr:MAG: 3-oxoacyl-(acyl-carrier-protein) synthase 2 [Firmicutes bacterium ADurb.Bin419]